MREGMVLYDADGREIWACPNVDSRASVEATTAVRILSDLGRTEFVMTALTRSDDGLKAFPLA